MSYNGSLLQETSPLGEPSSHFKYTPTGELGDAAHLPSDEHFIGAVVVNFSFVRAKNQPGLLVENTFIPPQDELMLPTKKTLIAIHDTLIAPVQETPKQDPHVTFAREARWLACKRLQADGHHILGGIIDYEDDVSGIFYAQKLPGLIQDAARLMSRAVDWGSNSDQAEKAMLREVTTTRTGLMTPGAVSNVMNVMVGCSMERPETFKQRLGWRDQVQVSTQAPTEQIHATSAAA